MKKSIKLLVEKLFDDLYDIDQETNQDIDLADQVYKNDNYYVIIPKPYSTLYQFLDKNYNNQKKIDNYDFITFWIFNAQETSDFYIEFKEDILGIYKFTDINKNWDELFEHIGIDIGYNYNAKKAKNFIKKFPKIDNLLDIY